MSKINEIINLLRTEVTAREEEMEETLHSVESTHTHAQLVLNQQTYIRTHTVFSGIEDEHLTLKITPKIRDRLIPTALKLLGK